MLVTLRWVTTLITTFVVVCLFSLSADARVPSANEVVTRYVTDEELYVLAVWENGPLFNGDRLHAIVHYPVESDAIACTERGCLNGCTIGYGYNMGAHNVGKVYADLLIVGVEPAKAKAMAEKYAEKTGVDAVAICGEKTPEADLHTITREQSWELLRVMAKEHKQNVVRRANREGVTHKLNSGQFAILVALDYQNPDLSSRANDVWRHIKNDRMRLITHEIRKRSGTYFTPALTPRRQWEGDYWDWATSLGRYIKQQEASLNTPTS